MLVCVLSEPRLSHTWFPIPAHSIIDSVLSRQGDKQGCMYMLAGLATFMCSNPSKQQCSQLRQCPSKARTVGVRRLRPRVLGLGRSPSARRVGAGFGAEPRKLEIDAVAGLGAEPRKKIGVFHAISSIFDVVLTPTGGLAAAVSTEKQTNRKILDRQIDRLIDKYKLSCMIALID